MVLHGGADVNVRDEVNAELAVLEHLTALEELDLSGRRLADASPLETLTALPALGRLDLSNAHVTDDCLPILQRVLGPLTSLQLDHNWQLTGELASGHHWGMSAALLSLPSLAAWTPGGLSLGFGVQNAQRAIAGFHAFAGNLRCLKELRIRDTRLSIAGCKALAALGPSLTLLDLGSAELTHISWLR